MRNNKGVALILIVLIIIGVLAIGGGTYYFLVKKAPKQVACTQEAKICPDGSTVGRTGPKCEFTECPTVKTDETADWKTYQNNEYGFEIKYPNGFFDLNHEPKVLIGDCNYSVFPNECPNINDIVVKDQAADGGDINIIKSNISMPNYWKKPNGEKLTINNVPYCLYQTEDAGMGHVYNYYYYATVKSQKCLITYLATDTVNCEFYLPIETGNTEQQKNYNNCLATNQNQPKILGQILSTFKFTK